MLGHSRILQIVQILSTTTVFETVTGFYFANIKYSNKKTTSLFVINSVRN